MNPILDCVYGGDIPWSMQFATSIGTNCANMSEPSLMQSVMPITVLVEIFKCQMSKYITIHVHASYKSNHNFIHHHESCLRQIKSKSHSRWSMLLQHGIFPFCRFYIQWLHMDLTLNKRCNRILCKNRYSTRNILVFQFSESWFSNHWVSIGFTWCMTHGKLLISFA